LQYVHSGVLPFLLWLKYRVILDVSPKEESFYLSLVSCVHSNKSSSSLEMRLPTRRTCKILAASPHTPLNLHNC
jgi:hypothetical protein